MNDARVCDHPDFVLVPVADDVAGPALKAIACEVCGLVVGYVRADLLLTMADRRSARVTAESHHAARHRFRRPSDQSQSRPRHRC